MTEATPEDLQEQAAPLLDPDAPDEAPDPAREADVADQIEQGQVVPPGEGEDEG